MQQRRVGVDVARGLALLGMMAVHVYPQRGTDGATTLAHAVFSGRAAALFAVLAGVGLALLTGGARPRVEGARTTVVLRALVLVVLGLALGGLDSGVAVILAYYGVFFLLAVPLLGLRVPPLVAAAGALLVGGAVLGWVLRSVPGLLPERLLENPALGDPPSQALWTLLVTGYYPALSWVGYLAAGLAVGRLALGERRVQVALLAGGTGLAAAASALSGLLLGPLGGAAAIRAVEGPTVDLAGNQFGDVPTSTAWWLAVDAPHATTPLDLLGTTGTALAVLGLALLLTGPARSLLRPLAAAGAMPLTLYSVHVVVLSLTKDATPDVRWGAQVAAFLVAAPLWLALFPRGPLEALVAAASRRPREPATR